MKISHKTELFWPPEPEQVIKTRVFRRGQDSDGSIYRQYLINFIVPFGKCVLDSNVALMLWHTAYSSINKHIAWPLASYHEAIVWPPQAQATLFHFLLREAQMSQDQPHTWWRTYDKMWNVQTGGTPFNGSVRSHEKTHRKPNPLHPPLSLYAYAMTCFDKIIKGQCRGKFYAWGFPFVFYEQWQQWWE